VQSPVKLCCHSTIDKFVKGQAHVSNSFRRRHAQRRLCSVKTEVFGRRRRYTDICTVTRSQARACASCRRSVYHFCNLLTRYSAVLCRNLKAKEGSRKVLLSKCTANP